MIKLFTVKEKLMCLFSDETAVSHALERIKNEFKATDPSFYEYAKYQYDIKFEKEGFLVVLNGHSVIPFL